MRFYHFRFQPKGQIAALVPVGGGEAEAEPKVGAAQGRGVVQGQGAHRAVDIGRVRGGPKGEQIISWVEPDHGSRLSWRTP